MSKLLAAPSLLGSEWVQAKTVSYATWGWQAKEERIAAKELGIADRIGVPMSVGDATKLQTALERRANQRHTYRLKGVTPPPVEEFSV